jgi:phosphodiester glycosidase
MRPLLTVAIAASLVLALALGGLWAYAGSYGLHVLVRHGGTYWINVRTDDPRLSPSMRLALGAAPPATAGQFAWREITPGFEAAELPVIAGGAEVDRILLARVDPARFRFEIRNSAAGDKDLDQWMAALGAALVINGSYYSRYGTPDTPFVSAGTLLGPRDYDARAGAFVAAARFTGIRDLRQEDWHAALRGADNAMVSYPLLVAEGRAHKLATSSRWLANRSFVGQDRNGWIVLGTTSDAFFPLDRFAEFLGQAPLGLTLALNLDGGPVACQGIALAGFERRTHGKWEIQVDGNDAKLLTWPYGTVAMPIVLAVFPK